MGERSSYTPGTFCWTELTTTDQAEAKEFYGGLLGWVADDRPIGDGDYVYSMMQRDGKPVAAIATQPDQQRESGAPPLWNSYISVESADATAERAKELGATVHAPPFDVMDVGRMAVIQDPQGAHFELWEPKAHFGAALVNAPGALVWTSSEPPTSMLPAPSTAASSAGPLPPSRAAPNRICRSRTGTPTPAACARPPPGPRRSGWRTSAWRISTPRSPKVSKLGGAVHAGPIDISIAKIAVVADPQGAVFALYDGELES